VILLGTALTTGMLSFGRGLPAPQVPAAK
jgi:hypothetical protein